MGESGPSIQAQMAWVRHRSKQRNANPQFAAGWKYGYDWARIHKLSAELKADDPLPVVNPGVSDANWSDGCRRGINRFVKSHPPADAKTDGSLAKSGDSDLAKPGNSSLEPESSFIKPLKIVPRASEQAADSPAKPEESSIELPEMELTQTATEPKDDKNIPQENPELEERMERFRQDELVIQPDAPTDNSVPEVDWEPLAVPPATNSITIETDSAMPSPVTQPLPTAQPSNPDKSKSKMPGRNILRSKVSQTETNGIRPIHTPQQPAVTNTASPDAAKTEQSLRDELNSILVDPQELQTETRHQPRLIARPISGLIHAQGGPGEATPGDSWDEPSKARILDAPLFIPPSAIHQLPAAEPIDPQRLPQDIRNPVNSPAGQPVPELYAPRQAVPAHNDIIR